MEIIHDWRDPYFGGHRPEPTGDYLTELGQEVKANGAHLGLAVDADSDRFGIVDSQGHYHEANLILALLLDYLAETRGWKQGVARSVATTHLIDRVAAFHDMPVYETKVGFKNLADYIVKNLVTMVGEEADGFSMRGHLPEKDGILACILVTEMVARKKKDLPQLRGRVILEGGGGLFPAVESVSLARCQNRIAGQVKKSTQDLGWIADCPGCHSGWP